MRRCGKTWTASVQAVLLGAAMVGMAVTYAMAARPDALPVPPVPQPAVRPPGKPSPVATQPIEGAPKPVEATIAAQAARAKRLGAARTWGYQLSGASIEVLARSPYDVLVIDAAMSLASGKAITRDDVTRLQKKPDGGKRIVIGYLSIGEAEDFRDYHAREYSEEEAPDWMLQKRPDWSGNRLVSYCSDGWQKTILGDAAGRSFYDSIQRSPMHRLIDLGLDGVMVDRVEVYHDVKAQCPGGEQPMVDFIVKLAAVSRQANPQFMVLQQNGDELLKHAALVQVIDGVAKEALFFGWSGAEGAGESAVKTAAQVKRSVERLNVVKAAGKAVFTVDYAGDKAQSDSALKRSRDLGYVPYIAPRQLHQLWLPGKNY